MEYILPIVFVIGLLFYLFNRGSFSSRSKRISQSSQNAELIKVLLNLDQDSLEELFKLYRQQFGNGAARYARVTYLKWKAGEVRPNRETFRRFLLYLGYCFCDVSHPKCRLPTAHSSQKAFSTAAEASKTRRRAIPLANNRPQCVGSNASWPLAACLPAITDGCGAVELVCVLQ